MSGRKRKYKHKIFRKAGLMDPELQGLPPEEARAIAQRKHDEKEARKAENSPEHQFQKLRDREWSR